MASIQSPIISMHGVTKRFGALTANDRIDIDVSSGTIHAIVGENGAGKTTLMRILYGVYRPDEGEIKLRGQTTDFHSPMQAIKAGVGMVTQHYSIIPELLIIDNLMLGAELTQGFLLDRKAAIERADELAKRIGFNFNWRALASTLSPTSSQKLEILKLLWRDSDILILDEPTAMLSPSDSNALFDNLHKLCDDSPRTILFVTHKLDEVMQHAQQVTVLRGGKKIADADVAGTSREQLTQWIVGQQINPIKKEPPRSFGEPMLTVSELTVRGDRGDIAVNSISLEIRSEEIVGIAGVDGNGQAELVEAIVGLRPVISGSIRFREVDLSRQSIRRRMELGLRYLPNDRLDGLIEDWSVSLNSVLGFHRKPPIGGLLMQSKAVNERARELVSEFDVKTPSLESSADLLSGGNQQRLMAARELYGEPNLLVACQPTCGLDISGAEQVHNVIRDKCAIGMAALVVSFDLDELIELCDRIVVMFRGKLFALPDGESKNRELIGLHMVGGAPR